MIAANRQERFSLLTMPQNPHDLERLMKLEGPCAAHVSLDPEDRDSRLALDSGRDSSTNQSEWILHSFSQVVCMSVAQGGAKSISSPEETELHLRPPNQARVPRAAGKSSCVNGHKSRASDVSLIVTTSKGEKSLLLMEGITGRSDLRPIVHCGLPAQWKATHVPGRHYRDLYLRANLSAAEMLS